MAQALAQGELLALVDALADGAWHSGEALAAASGMTRAGLAKRIDRLRAWELQVEARLGLGYRLAQPLQRLDGAALRAALPQLSLEVLPVTDSTNTQLLAADPARDPQALLAEFQSAGRGRRGRGWVSPFGANLYCSLAWSFVEWPRQLTTLPLVVGIACAQTVRELGLAEAGLKWPNDLLLEERKLGGILVEHRGEAGGACRVVIGIGLNVAMSEVQATGVTQPWVALHAAQTARGLAPTTRTALAAALLARLHAALLDFTRHGFDAFVPAWRALDVLHDRPVRVAMPQGELLGTARGVDEQGALLVDAAGERHRLHAGEVSLRLVS